MAKEENIITPEEFGDIEKSEEEIKEKSRRFKLFGRRSKEKKPEAKDKSATESLTDLTLKVERLLGRVEILENNRTEVNEQVGNIDEKIGELRSSLIERDKTYSKLARDFDKISEIAKELEPEKILRNLEKKQVQIEKNDAKLESVEDRLSILSKKFKDLSDTTEQVKGLKDLVSVADELNKKIRIVDDLKNKTEKTAGKVETLFYELQENLNKVQVNLGKIETNEDMVKEMLRTVDKLSLKLEGTVPEQKLNESEKEFEEKLSELKFDTESKFKELVDAVKETNKKIRAIDEKSLKDILKKGFAEKLAESSKLYEELNQKIEKLEIQKGSSENLDKRFSDLELKILELSKGVDNRIERRLGEKDKMKASFYRKPKEEPVQTQDRKQEVKTIKREREYTQTDSVNSLINYIETLISSGNFAEARNQFIRLLSKYEEQEESSPFLLEKITEFHNKLKNLS